MVGLRWWRSEQPHCDGAPQLECMADTRQRVIRPKRQSQGGRDDERPASLMNRVLAYDVSADGSVVAGWSDGVSSAVRWFVDGGEITPTPVPTLDTVTGISADGSAVVGASARDAVRWKAGRGTKFLSDNISITQSEASAVSANGAVVVGSDSSIGHSQAFRWTYGGGMANLGALSSVFAASVATAVSDDGLAVVGYSASDDGTPAALGVGIEAFRWMPASGMAGLGFLPDGRSDSSRAHGVSADGAVVVGMGSSPVGSAAPFEAFIWDSTNGMQELDQLLAELGLDLTGWELESATAISADGLTIVGNGLNPDGDREAWIATIPEPSTALLLGIGLVGLMGLGGRRHHHRSRGSITPVASLGPLKRERHVSLHIHDFTSVGLVVHGSPKGHGGYDPVANKISFN